MAIPVTNEEKAESWLDSAKKDMESLITSKFKDNSEAFKSAMDDFWKTAKEDLKRWGLQLLTGDLEPGDFADLVKDQKDLLKLKGIVLASEAQNDVNEVKTEFLQIIISKFIN